MRSNYVYLSDYLAVPAPKSVMSRKTFRKKLQKRKLLWSVLPYAAEAVLLTPVIVILMAGASLILCGLGR